MPLAAIAAIGVAGGVATSAIGAHAAGKAADTQANAALQGQREANALQEKIYNQNRQDSLPWLNTGQAALAQLANLMGLQPQQVAPQAVSNGSTQQFRNGLPNGPRPAQVNRFGQQPLRDEIGFNALDAQRGKPPVQTNTLATGQQPLPADFGSLNHDFGMQDFQVDPGYLFRLQEGEKAINRSAAAKGGLLSGAAVKAANRFNQDYASNEYGNAFNRFNINRTDRYNRYANLAGLGQQAASQLANSGSNYANQAGNNIINGLNSAANARASGYVGQANAINSGIGQGINGIQQLLLLRNLGLGH